MPSAAAGSAGACSEDAGSEEVRADALPAAAGWDEAAAGWDEASADCAVSAGFVQPANASSRQASRQASSFFMREIRLALLEADVSYKVVKDFTKSVTERAVGTDVLESLTPAQMIIKIVNEELTKLMDPATGLPAGDSIEQQARQSCKNVAAVLEAGGSSLKKVVKTTCFLADMADFPAFNRVYEEFFTEKPARSCVAVRELPKDVLCEIEAVAEL